MRGFAWAAIAVAALPAVSFGFGKALPIWVNGTGVWQEADDAILISPANITMAAGDTTPSIFGEFYKSGVTESAGPGTGVVAQLGYGAFGSDPRTSTWTWLPVTYDQQDGNFDEYLGNITINTVGTYTYTYRFSLDNGGTWTAADLAGCGANPAVAFNPNDIGTLNVTNTPVPEPASVSVLGTSVFILLRRKKA